MRIGVVGCGYVFDHYMTTIDRHPALEIAGVTDLNADRARAVGDYYNLPVFPDLETILAQDDIDCIANFTSIPSHFAVSKAALEAGRHVYSEKPLTTTMEEARALADLAESRGLRLSSAPSNFMSASVQTLWEAVETGRAGQPRLVYAEFDDNPIHLLSPGDWTSRSGAPWPWTHEFEMGCTWEHAGYHLAWLCAIFGPVRHLTAFSKQVLPDKSDVPLDPPDTPDFSVAVLDFESGVTARLTCSIAAPLDQRMRVIGTEGEISVDTYKDYDAPVRLERFTPRALKARNYSIARHSGFLQRALGIGGRVLPMRPALHPARHDRTFGAASPVTPKGAIARLKRRQTGGQDKAMGLAELAAAIAENRPHWPTPDFTLHLTELTLAIQAAGPDGATRAPQTRFEPLRRRD